MRLALYPLVQQFQYRNGTNLVAGKIYVYYRGRTRLATIYKDQNGTIAQNPLTCDADGRAPCFVDTNYQYTIVVCDARGKELFSQDLDADNAININDALSGDSKLYIINSDGTISVNATSGDTWIQYDLGTFNKPLGVIEPLYWEQDDEEASIIGLHTEGLVSGISADFTELSAKVDELSGDVGYLSGASDYLSGVVEQKMDKSQSSDFYPASNPSGFIGDEGLSEYQPISGMTAYQVAGDYYSASNPSGFITGVDLSNYVQETELQSVSADITAMIPTALTGDYLTKESADTLYQPTGDYLVPDDITGKQDTLTFDYTTADEISGINGSALYGQGGGITGDYELSAGEGISIVNDPIEEKTVISVSGDYATNTDLQTVSGEITAMIPTALTGDYLDKASADTLYYGINNPSGFITGVDLTPYQTVEGMTAYQTAGDYATNTQLSEVSSTITAMIPAGEYELCAGSGIELVDDPNAKTTTISVTAQGGNPEVEAEVIAHSADWNTVGDKLDTTAFSDVSGDFLTAHQDLSDYQTTAGMTAYQPVGDYLTAVPDTYLQNTDLTIVDNKVTEISGVPLSAGDELPATVMDTSGLEYNSQGYINGYNGSAVATIDQERQWFTHDDTLCHISNSAQYALGVNMSAISADLARMMGVDETVIWTQDGNFDGPGKTLTFSEPASAFEKLEFRCGVDVQNKECVTIEYHPGNAVVAWHEYYTNQFRQFYSLLSINDSGATAVSGCPYFANLAQNATFTGQTVNWTWCFKAITAIRGIGRKS